MRPAASGRRSRPVHLEARVNSRGFTLIELVVALTVAAIALAVVPVSMVRLYDGMQYRSAVRDVLAGLKTARVEAGRRGEPVPFTLDTVERRYWIGGVQAGEL